MPAWGASVVDGAVLGGGVNAGMLVFVTVLVNVIVFFPAICHSEPSTWPTADTE